MRVEPLEDRRMLSVTLFVDADAASNGDGLSWPTAFDDLQSALESAATFNSDQVAENDVDAIWIAEGTYVPTVEAEAGDSRSAQFSLVDGVTLYGGFVGTEPSLGDRDADPTAHETVLSGEVDDPAEFGDNLYTVIACAEGVTAALDGLTVTRAASDSDLGAITNDGTAALTGVSVSENGAQAIRSEGTLTVTGSSISDNGGCGIWSTGTLDVAGSVVAENGFDWTSPKAASVKGGIYNAGTATVTDTQITGNLSSIGGGVANWDGTLVMRDCVVSENSATFRGGGISNEQNFATAVVTLENCVVTGNATTQNSEGGGIFNFGTLNVAATVIAGNAADADGGGIFTVGTLNLTNSTVAANTAKGNGGGICQYVDTATAAINNTIVALNEASTANDLFNVEGAVSGAHNLISNGSDQTEFIDAADGNLVGTAADPIDPRFLADPSPGDDGDWGTEDDDFGDLRLRLDSPAVDAGNTALAVDAFGTPLTVDLDGDPRVQGTAVDMGAYESPPPVDGDINLDGAVNSDDLDVVRANWGQSVPPGSITDGDLNADGKVNSDDLNVIRANWGLTARFRLQAAAADAYYRGLG